MLQSSDLGSDPRSFGAALGRRLPDLDAFARDTLCATYDSLHALRAAGRNHIWGFVARNLVRPVWLSLAAAARRRRDRQSALAGLPLHVGRRSTALPRRIATAKRLAGRQRRHPPRPLGLLLCSLLRALSGTKRANCLRHALCRHEPASVPGLSFRGIHRIRRWSDADILVWCASPTPGRWATTYSRCFRCRPACCSPAWSVTKARCRQPSVRRPASCRGATRRRLRPNPTSPGGTRPGRRSATMDAAGSPYRAAFRQGATLVPRFPVLGGISPGRPARRQSRRAPGRQPPQPPGKGSLERP